MNDYKIELVLDKSTSTDEFEKLSHEEKKSVIEALKNIDVNSNSLDAYGYDLQLQLSGFSDIALNNSLELKDSEVSKLIIRLLNALERVKPQRQKNFLGIIKKDSNNETFDSLKEQIDNLVAQLIKYETILSKNVMMLDILYKRNLKYLKEINRYIIVGDLLLKKISIRCEELSKDNNEESRIMLFNLNQRSEQFKRKLFDLRLTKEIAMQTLPQIRLIQTNTYDLMTNIESICTNTIPLWKNQLVVSSGLENNSQAMNMLNKINDMINSNNTLVENLNNSLRSSIENEKSNEMRLTLE